MPIQMVNKRVSDLGDYKTVAEAGIYFPTGVTDLDAAAKADLDKVAQIAMTTENYMIEVAGYASSTGTKAENQKLSDCARDRRGAVSPQREERSRCAASWRLPATVPRIRPPATPTPKAAP